MELLEVNHLCKTYGSGETAVHALKDVSFSVPKGEYVAVVGESGSGKSTLLNLIGGLDTPTSGKVLIDGKDVFAMKDRELTIFRRRNIGFIFQAFNLIPELTVEQNILFPVLLDYQKPDRAYLEELLTVLNLKDRRKHLPSQLSGGQQQRVAIGRALMTRPSLILADEPTGNLDTQNTSEVIALLKETSRKYEQTILMITHNRSIAQTAEPHDHPVHRHCGVSGQCYFQCSGYDAAHPNESHSRKRWQLAFADCRNYTESGRTAGTAAGRGVRRCRSGVQ